MTTQKATSKTSTSESTTLVGAMTTSNVTTENGMVTNSTAGKECVNMFFQIGALRSSDEKEIEKIFSRAFGEDKLVALKTAFYSRDILQGQGERRTFRVILNFLEQNHPDILKKNLHLVSEFGRWDDLIVLENTSLEENVLTLFSKALTDGKNGLCAKWTPRGNSKTYPTFFNKLRKYMKLTPKELRTTLVELTKTANVVEQLMCAKSWSDIEYSKISSIAIKNYRKSFFTHDEKGFNEYIENLKKGETKISAKAIFPHDIIKPLIGWGSTEKGEADLLEQQWNALPNFMEGSTESIIPVCDVSGSMDGLPMEVCVSLGLYIAERNEGIFKDTFITFSDRPTVEQVQGATLKEKAQNLSRADWGGSTNLTATFDLILTKAQEANVPKEQMPSTILIMSDMEFNSCTRNADDTAFEAIKNRYEEAGYKTPRIVFWNLNARNKENFPVRFDQRGTALVSGFSPSILTSLLAGKNITPESIMFETIGKERYNIVTI